MNMAPTATKEGEMTKEEEAKALKTEKRKKAEASKKEEPSAKIAKNQGMLIESCASASPFN